MFLGATVIAFVVQVVFDIVGKGLFLNPFMERIYRVTDVEAGTNAFNITLIERLLAEGPHRG